MGKCKPYHRPISSPNIDQFHAYRFPFPCNLKFWKYSKFPILSLQAGWGNTVGSNIDEMKHLSKPAKVSENHCIELSEPRIILAFVSKKVSQSCAYDKPESLENASCSQWVAETNSGSKVWLRHCLLHPSKRFPMLQKFKGLNKNCLSNLPESHYFWQVTQRNNCTL